MCDEIKHMKYFFFTYIKVISFSTYSEEALDRTFAPVSERHSHGGVTPRGC